MKQKIFTAAFLGTKAFRDGKDRVPAYDKQLMDLLTITRVGDGASRILSSWLENYDFASFNSEKCEG